MEMRPESILLVLLVMLKYSLTSGCTEESVSAKYSAQASCSGGHIGKALKAQAKCEPRMVVVQLPWPNSTMVGGGVQQMTPTHVALMQCDGGCHRGSQGCIATATRTREVSVMVGKCGVSVGKCEKECATVTLEEHTKCGCGCHLDRLQCEHDGLHKFKKELCQCECKDVEAKRSCLEQGRTWEEDSCTCGCPAVLSCTSGSVYSFTTCMCEPEETNDLLTKEDRAPRSNKSSIFSGEIIIIGVLLGLILIMLMIIFSLINKLQSVKRRIKLRRLTAEAQNNVDIYSELGKKDAMLKPKEQSYAQLYCDSPSSGFASRSGSAKYSEPEAESSPEPCQECLYQSAESVRVNKRLHSVPCPSPAIPPSQRTLDRRAAHQGGGGGVVQPSPAAGQISQYGQLRVSGDGQGFSTAVTRQIDEAVRLLESSAAQL